MKQLLRLLVLMSLAAGLLAQNSLPTYTVITTEKKDAYFDATNDLADQGYRVVAVGKFTVLRLEATPPDTYRYSRVESKDTPSELVNWLNAQGARGYRWRPPIGLLEKSPHPRNFEYRTSPHGAWAPPKGGELSAEMRHGYRPLAVVLFPHFLGSPTEELFSEREVGKQTPATTQCPSPTVELVHAVRISKVMKRVNDLAKQGYRFLAPMPGGGSDVVVAMVKCSEESKSRYVYRHLRDSYKEAAQLERDLNVSGAEGFRILPAAISRTRHIVEEDVSDKRTFAYRAIALNPSDPAELQQSLDAAERDGYRPIDISWWHLAYAGDTSRADFLLVEMETTGSPAP
jgi:hypothetical protein